MRAQPSGTVTFLFTDVVGSTAAWESDPASMADALAVHDRVLRDAIERNEGHVFATGGDGYAVAFQRSADAIAAAVVAQRELRVATWPDERELTVRMGIHTGETVERGGDYFGPAVNRAARVMDAGNGGQLIVSAVSRQLAGDLGDGLATTPLGAHRFKGLDDAIEVVEIVIDEHDDLGALRTGGGDTHGLPSYVTSFVGRERESAELRAALAEHRLVSLVGPGGSGKTRLASSVGEALAGDHADGVWFVDLSDVRNDGDVVVQLGASLELGGPLTPDELSTALAGWRAVLILDNCEQVLEGVADVVESLLVDCGGLSLVATTREPLAVEGERVIPLGPLGEDDVGDEAVGLFLARARLVAPTFRPDPAEMEQIAALCEALDRLPLAIELAASRADRMAIADIADGLLSGRSERRTRRRRGRHADLRSVLAWSTDLLEQDERVLWRRLAIFEGGFTTSAAVEVAGVEVAGVDPVRPAEVSELLDSLVDRSLVVRTRTSTGMRHRLLATMRAVALDELAAADEMTAVRDRHAAWARTWSSDVLSRPAAGWMPDWSEADNQRHAVRHLVERDDGVGAASLLADSITPIFCTGHAAEAASLARAVREIAPDDPVIDARLDEVDMVWAEWNGDFGRSHELTEQLRAADVDDRSWSFATALQAHHFAALDPPAAVRLLDESTERLGEDPRTVFLRAEAAAGAGRFDEAVDEHLRGWGVPDVETLRRNCVGQLIDPTMLSDLVVALLVLGRTDEAGSALAALAESDLAPMLEHYVPMLRGALLATLGDLETAVAALDEAATIERRVAVPILATDVSVAAAHVALEAGRPDLARPALLAVRSLGQRTMGAFGWRRRLRERLATEFDEAEPTDRGAAAVPASPRSAVGAVVDGLRRGPSDRSVAVPVRG